MNYIGVIVKILETPKQSLLANNVVLTKVRAQLAAHLGTNQMVNLTFWGNLAQDVANYYKTNDYLIIEGYLSFKNKSKSNVNYPVLKKLKITVLKVDPFLLN